MLLNISLKILALGAVGFILSLLTLMMVPASMILATVLTPLVLIALGVIGCLVSQIITDKAV